MPILVNLDVVLAKRKRSLSELSDATGITIANLSRLKNGRSRGIRFSSLHKICYALDCVPGDILERITTEEYVKLLGRLPLGEGDDDEE
jgi:putative transcriptional regulator